MLSSRNLDLSSSESSSRNRIQGITSIKPQDFFPKPDLFHVHNRQHIPHFPPINHGCSRQYELSYHIHMVGASQGTLIPDILDMLTDEIILIEKKYDQHSGAHGLLPSGFNTLFRANSPLTKAMEFAMRFYGREWLQESLQEVVATLVRENVLVEVDVGKLQAYGAKPVESYVSLIQNATYEGPRHRSATELDLNTKQLVKWCSRIWDSIWNARESCPECAC